MYLAERQLRVGTDGLLDDTCLEFLHEKFAEGLEVLGDRHVRLIRRVLVDGDVTPVEAVELIDDALAVRQAIAINREGCTASIARNVAVQRQFTRFEADLSTFLREKDPVLRDAHRWLRADCGDCLRCRDERCELVGGRAPADEGPRLAA